MTIVGGLLTSILTSVLSRNTVDVPAQDAPVVAGQIAAEIKADKTIAVVPVTSAWTSKINLTQLFGILFTIGALFGIDVPPEIRAYIISGIVAIMAVVTWFFRTFITRSVTKSSLKNS